LYYRLVLSVIMDKGSLEYITQAGSDQI